MKKGRQRLLTFSKRRWFRPEIQGDEGILPFLPDEILLMILRHLDIKQLGLLSSVAKRLHEASSFDDLWRPIFHRQFSEWLTCEELTSSTVSWKDKVKSCVSIQTKWANHTETIENEDGKKRYDILFPPSPFDLVPEGHTFTLLLLGGIALGVGDFLDAMFPDHLSPHHFNESYEKKYDIEGKRMIAEVAYAWGQGSYKGILDSYTSRAQGFVFVYSVESYASFSAVREQYKQVLRIKEGRDPHNIPMALIGAKVRGYTNANREVPKDEGKNLAKEWKIPFLEIAPRSPTALPRIESCIRRLLRGCAKYYCKHPPSIKQGKKKGLVPRLKGSKEKLRQPPPATSFLVNPNGTIFRGAASPRGGQQTQQSQQQPQPEGEGKCLYSIVDSPMIEFYDGGWLDGRRHAEGVIGIRDEDNINNDNNDNNKTDCNKPIRYRGEWCCGVLVRPLRKYTS